MDLEKLAYDGSESYLSKCAAIVTAYNNGEVSAEDADLIAEENGIAPSDVAALFTADMEKTASEDEEVEALVKVALDDDSSYLTKCAAIADLFENEIIDGNEADDMALEMGIDPADVESVYSSAYLDKDAGENWDKVKDFYTKDFKEGKKYHGKVKMAHGVKKALNLSDSAVKEMVKDPALRGALRESISEGKKKVSKAGRSALMSAAKHHAIGAGKIGGTLGAAGLAGYGAYKATE